jgi:two-component system response regulator VicR
MAKILLVEDDFFIAEIYMRSLQKAGFEVVSAATGSQAVEMIAKEKPDLVLLDIMLPDFDGFEVLERVNKQKLETRLPIIMVSNLGDDESISKATGLGADDYMVKANITPQDIVARVKQTLKIP